MLLAPARTRRAVACFGAVLVATLATHQFQAYSTRMATLGCAFAALMAWDSRMALAAPLLCCWGLRYWDNFPRGPVALQDPSLAGLYAADDGTDRLVERLRANPGDRTVTLNHLVYFALNEKPRTRYMHQEYANQSRLPLPMLRYQGQHLTFRN